jgi:hypothetical protein
MAFTPLWQQQLKKRQVKSDWSEGSDGTDPNTPDLTYNIVGTKPEEIIGSPISTIPSDPTFNTFNPTTIGMPTIEGTGTTGTSWLDSILQQAGTTASQYFSNPSAFPAIATAIQQWNNASQYGDQAKEAAGKYNPFGQYRQGYGDQLQALYADPSSIENTPGYKFRLSQGLGIVGPKAAAAHQGYGNEYRAMEDYAQGLASTEYGAEVDRLSKLAGANIDGSTAAQVEMNGLNNQIAAQNGALQALATPFGQSTANNTPGVTINNSNGGGSNSNTPNGSNTVPSGLASQASQAIAAGGQTGMQAASQLISQGYRFLNNPDGSTTDLYAAARIGTGEVESGYPAYPTDSSVQWWNNQGNLENAPPDTGYEFGGNTFGVTDPPFIEEWYDWGGQ